jgi:hypothetical protein
VRRWAIGGRGTASDVCTGSRRTLSDDDEEAALASRARKDRRSGGVIRQALWAYHGGIGQEIERLFEFRD